MQRRLGHGVVHRFADLLTSMGISIIEIITDTENAPLTGAAIFRMSAKMHLNDRTKQKLEEKLEDLKKILDNRNLDIHKCIKSTDDIMQQLAADVFAGTHIDQLQVALISSVILDNKRPISSISLEEGQRSFR